MLRWLAVVAVVACTIPVFSQIPEVRLSPHEGTEETFAGRTVRIEYGRPYRKGRKVIGGILHNGQLWRTGADEAPVLVTNGTLTIGSLIVRPGAYTVLTIPGKDHWTLIVNRNATLRGTYLYSKKKDLGRIEMDVGQTPEMIEQFTITIRKNTETSGILEMSWENTVVSVSFSVS
jgi:hypothetical protein